MRIRINRIILIEHPTHIGIVQHEIRQFLRRYTRNILCRKERMRGAEPNKYTSALYQMPLDPSAARDGHHHCESLSTFIPPGGRLHCKDLSVTGTAESLPVCGLSSSNFVALANLSAAFVSLCRSRFTITAHWEPSSCLKNPSTSGPAF